MPTIVRDPLDPRISHWHWLAWQLRRLRERNDLSLTQVGQLVGAARSTVSNVESGRRRFDLDQLQELDRRYSTDGLLEHINWFAQMSHDPDWYRQGTEYEFNAGIIKIYQGQSIPGPLQTEDTIRALLSANTTGADFEDSVKSRIARQRAILERANPPYVWLLLDEAALEYEVGGREVLRAQLAHLVEAGRSPQISIRVIPKKVGAHLGQDGPMRIWQLDERSVAYVGAQRGGRLIESPAEVRELRLDYDLIGQKALSDEDTRTLITGKMEDLQ